ncbi:hypothetical protein Lal_00035009 [Lupinus albus]|nr:hypothetical protein Lal_00035009 [Lupinus albus]
MILSASTSPTRRSRLEEMLDSLRQKDEEQEQMKNSPPALPPRPISKGRLPPARRSLPNDFKVSSGGGAEECSPNGFDAKEESNRKEKELGLVQKRSSSFGSKRVKMDVGSPYMVTLQESKSLLTSTTSSGKIKELENDSISYFIKKMSGHTRQDRNRNEDIRDKVEVTPIVEKMVESRLRWFRHVRKRPLEASIRMNQMGKLGVWCKQPRGQWELGTIQSTSGEEASVLLSNGNVTKVAKSELLPANPYILEGTNDLVKLSYLNEPSIVHNLQLRYSKEMIYTKAGPILIALNPFKDLQIYGNDYVPACRQKFIDSPHVYAMADAAYNEMITDEVNQSIIISGESGSGKTEMGKFVIQYLAAVGGGSCGIENKILQTSCILEAFGNAKTSNNDNSSRFVSYQGKLIEMHFSAMERLNLRDVSDYKYLNQSDCMTIGGIDDAKKFQELTKALDAVRVCEDDQELIFKMVAAILWLGNISFLVTDSENCIEVVDDEAVTSAARLMGCSSQELMAALSTHGSQSENGTIAKRLKLQQAIDTRDAIAKFIYASLFEWLVEQLNKSLQVGKKCTGKSISILDIYGFETLQKNSFEQFCINYANERLQQHFYRHLFKLEQEDYESDGIDWTKIDFEDNQECLNLFEKKPLGLLSLLDEESNLPKASDLTFANKLKQHLDANPCFKRERGRAFCVRHYTGEFFSKAFCQTQKQSNSIHTVALDSQKQSIGTKFKDQLFKLMRQLESTKPHFIRCIRPNTKQRPGIYDVDLVLQQLRCCGVPEVARISRVGYPTRITHEEFSRRYGFLLSEVNIYQDPLSISIAVLQEFNIPFEMYHFGHTKLFLRAGQIGALEDKRKLVLQGILLVQKCFRGYQARSYFREFMNGVTTLQSGTAVVRGEITRRKHGLTVQSYITIYSKNLEEINAIILLQSVIRGWVVRRDASGMNKSKYPENAKPRQKSRARMPEVKDMTKEQDQSALEELQRRAVNAEAIAEQKEEENTELKKQLKRSEERWTEYEAKMKSVEETRQKQMASLQTSLVAARKSLASGNATVQHARHDVVPTHYFGSEEATSMGSPTSGRNTPVKFSSGLLVSDGGRQVNGTSAAVSNLTKEFELRRQNFDDEVKVLNDHKQGQSAKADNIQELRKLKDRFEAWKKQYKVRLRETKARLLKAEGRKSRWSWWEKLSLKGK